MERKIANIFSLPIEVRRLIYELLDPFDLLNLRESVRIFRKEIKPIDNETKRDVLIIAATRGYLSIVEYRSKRRFVWCRKIEGMLGWFQARNENIRDVALVSKQLGLTSSVAVLAYLKQNQYNLDINMVCSGACESGNLDIVKWCWKMGASPGPGHILTAKMNKHQNIVKWLNVRN
jgi:hypothetical protein